MLQIPTVQRFDSTAYEVHGGAPVAKHVYKIANPPVYAFNPVMHEDTILTQVMVAIYLKFKGNGKLQTHLLQHINFNKVDTNNDYISTLVPVDCATSLIASITHSDAWDLTDNYEVYLRFEISFVSTDIGRSGNPNQSFLVFMYPVTVDVITNSTLINDPLNSHSPCHSSDPAKTHQFVKDYCSGLVKGMTYQAYLLNDTAPGQHIVQNGSNQGNFNINIYPNPAHNNAVLSMNLPENSTMSMFITDVRGRILKQCFKNKTFSAGISEFVIDVSDLSYGVYFCKIFSPNMSQVKKLVISE